MRRTLSNLEKEEAAIVAAFKEGSKHGTSMREHLNNIRKHALYEAVDGCKNFEQYVKLKRLPMEYRSANRLVCQAEAESYVEKGQARLFSGEALTELSRIRVVDKETGKRKHDMDVPKIRQVARKVIAHHEKTGDSITGPLVKQTIESMPWSQDKIPKPLDVLLDAEIKRVGKWILSLDQLDEDVFLDANKESPGIVTRLAKVYSEVASLLRRKVKP